MMRFNKSLAHACVLYSYVRRKQIQLKILRVKDLNHTLREIRLFDLDIPHHCFLCIPRGGSHSQERIRPLEEVLIAYALELDILQASAHILQV